MKSFKIIRIMWTATDKLCVVKFDGEQLPLILNALETDNGGNKLVLEVAVGCEG